MSVKAVRVKDIMGVMEEIAPKKLAENWDKPGLAIGDPEREVKKILVALDVIDPVVEEAKRIGADMIVTHHPMLLFRKIESITADTLLGKRIFNLIQNNIAAFSAHTNLDIAAGGTNDVLAELAGLKNIEILEETWAESLKKIVVYVPVLPRRPGLVRNSFLTLSIMRKFLLFAVVIAAMLAAACSKYKYETVAGDPLNTRIYTLDNGLKVYMSVNKEAPRIQTYIAVKVGGKNDPAETTGLAHYFEHLMFKGTDKFGTQDYEAEKPMLDEIERLYEVYRATDNDDERKAIYAQIDSVSQEASKIAIPNEYDKLMSAISAEGSNAWTSFDETVYTEDIPSNQIENWAKIQSERFKNAVIRGFHTELETVYEEYNMSLTRDDEKVPKKLSLR